MSSVRAETPQPLDSIYAGRGEDVDPLRPVFTGDVFSRESGGAPVIVLQHPCALRADGVELVDRILVAEVAPIAEVTKRANARTDWADESMRAMPLPGLYEDGKDYAVDFRRIDALNGSEFQGGLRRVAILSLSGVNVLQQRWIRHNSRVLIPTGTYAEQIIGPYEEADLAAEWLFELDGVPAHAASQMHDFAKWIAAPAFQGDRRSRQDLLEEAQSRSSVRRAMLLEVRERKQATSSK